jgi:transcriptional regulator of arginine metabolism
MVKKRNVRQDAIKWIVRNKSIRTQKALVTELHKAGYACTQATASRDISDMGLRKLPEGVYVLAEDLHLQRMVAEFVTDVEQIGTQVVIKSQPGTAPGIAAAIDAADIPELLATIAGSDTVLGICRTEEKAIATESILKKLHNPEAKAKALADRGDKPVIPSEEEEYEDEEVDE